MTVLIDTGVLYAEYDRDASRHESAAEILDRTYDGEFGVSYLSDYIYDEAVTLTYRRVRSNEAATRLGKRLRGVDPYPSAFELLHVSRGIFTDAVNVFEQYDDHQLSFTDATTIALSRRHDIDAVISFDDDFDGLVHRIDPKTA